MAGSKLPWLIAGTAAVAAVATLVIARPGSAGRHPAPRPGITGAKVLPTSIFGDDERLVHAYAAARAMPGIFDGIYCYCHCKEEMGHRSLLTCYESEHAASCDICLAEGTMAAEMYERGATLAVIRRAIDTRFKT